MQFTDFKRCLINTILTGLRLHLKNPITFHFLRKYLESLDYHYGDFDAHNGLWQMSVDTDYDVLARMALVPRVLEARGLDVTPSIRKKFSGSKFNEMVEY